MIKELTKGIFRENPVLMLLLGLCPTLGVSGKFFNAIGMGLGVIFVLVCSNAVISLMKKIIPNQVRIPGYIVIIATFVTIVELMLRAFSPVLYSGLGIFIPLIVVNCIVLGRAEAFAGKNKLLTASFWDEPKRLPERINFFRRFWTVWGWESVSRFR